MLTRRSFFTKAAAFVAGCALATKFSFAKEETFKKAVKFIPNPTYVDAPYEALYIYKLDEVVLKKPPTIIKRTRNTEDPLYFGTRYDINGNIVPPFIMSNE